MTDLRFSVQIPAQWQELDMGLESRTKMVDAQVAHLVNAMPSLMNQKGMLRRQLLGMLQSAWVAGVRYGASMAQPTGDGMLFACLTLSVIAAPASFDDETSPIDAIAVAVRNNNEEDGRRDMDMSIVTLPYAGKALRLFGVTRMSSGQGGGMECALMQTFVPAGDRVLLVQAVTPQVDVSDTMFELFDLITGTLRVETVAEDGRR